MKTLWRNEGMPLGLFLQQLLYTGEASFLCLEESRGNCFWPGCTLQLLCLSPLCTALLASADLLKNLSFFRRILPPINGDLLSHCLGRPEPFQAEPSLENSMNSLSKGQGIAARKAESIAAERRQSGSNAGLMNSSGFKRGTPIRCKLGQGWGSLQKDYHGLCFHPSLSEMSLLSLHCL